MHRPTYPQPAPSVHLNVREMPNERCACVQFISISLNVSCILIELLQKNYRAITLYLKVLPKESWSIILCPETVAYLTANNNPNRGIVICSYSQQRSILWSARHARIRMSLVSRAQHNKFSDLSCQISEHCFCLTRGLWLCRFNNTPVDFLVSDSRIISSVLKKKLEIVFWWSSWINCGPPSSLMIFSSLHSHHWVWWSWLN